MSNTFSEVNCSKGNVNLIFFEGSRQRHIIFNKGTQALTDYRSATVSLSIGFVGSVDDLYRAVINQLRKSYRFEVNKNNVSIFRPIAKLQTA